MRACGTRQTCAQQREPRNESEHRCNHRHMLHRPQSRLRDPALGESTDAACRFGRHSLHVPRAVKQVKSHLRSGSAPFSAPQLDALLAANAARSRELAAAERETEAFWVSEYFRQQTAADPAATWRAQLISWASQDAGTSSQTHCARGLEAVMVNCTFAPSG